MLARSRASQPTSALSKATRSCHRSFVRFQPKATANAVSRHIARPRQTVRKRHAVVAKECLSNPSVTTRIRRSSVKTMMIVGCFRMELASTNRGGGATRLVNVSPQPATAKVTVARKHAKTTLIAFWPKGEAAPVASTPPANTTRVFKRTIVKPARAVAAGPAKLTFAFPRTNARPERVARKMFGAKASDFIAQRLTTNANPRRSIACSKQVVGNRWVSAATSAEHTPNDSAPLASPGHSGAKRHRGGRQVTRSPLVR
jgi:hypothetical protein